jgi:RNA polymerase primary sigma factor
VDPLRLYLQQLGAVDLLDAEAEARLSRRMRRARAALVRIARALPLPARADILRGLDPAAPPCEWTDAELDRLVDALSASALASDSVELRTALTRARRERRRHAKARETMILANLKLVVHIAKRYSSSGVPLSDLIQEGNIGLLSAVDKFEPQRGNRFSTYAYWWIKQAIDRSIADRGRMIRIPVHLGEQRRKVARSISELKQRLNREPSTHEIAAQSGLPGRKVERVLHLAREPIRMDSAEDDDRSDPLDAVEELNTPSPYRETARHELQSQIRTALESLAPREAEIVRLRFGIDRPGPRTLEEIGSMLDLSRERVRQIQAAAMRKLHECRVLESLLEFGSIH